MTDDWDADEPLPGDGNERLEVKRDRLARLLGVAGRAPGRRGRRDPALGDRAADGDVEADRVPRPARARE